MRTKHIITIIGIILVICVSLYCFDTIRYTRSSQPPTLPFSVRIDGDSLYVDGATHWSQPLVIPFEYDVPTFDSHNDYNEAIRQERLKSPRRVKLNFTKPINSFSVHVILHPDEEDDKVGMAEWFFTKQNNTIRVNTGYSWDWKQNVMDQICDSIKYRGEIFTLVPSPQMVQGKDSIIVDTPFCFKDVDFDGEHELCFRTCGWNRYYFNAYKLLTSTTAELMTGHPYHNIVYSDVETCSTVFDYENRTIHLMEVWGSSVYDHNYGRRYEVSDPLNPMRHINGKECNYSGYTGNEDYFKDGKWVKSIIIYRLDDLTYGMEAEYVSSGDRHFAFKTLYCYTWEDETKRYILFSSEKK